jgi:DNA mismatch endonuclease (patch repair protein)
MPDTLTPSQRRHCMSKVKGKNTAPEMVLRRWLWSKGYRYRLHVARLSGKPDIVFSERKKVIFIHGCFWHKHHCGHFSFPKTNSEFWKKKIIGNVERDRNNEKILSETGWKFLIVWECEMKKGISQDLQQKILFFLEGD